MREQLLGYQMTVSFVPIRVQFRVVSCSWLRLNFHLVTAALFTQRITETGSFGRFDWVFLCDPPLFLLSLFPPAPLKPGHRGALQWRKTHGLSKQFRVHCKISQLCLCKIPVYPLTASQLCSANAGEMVCVRSSRLPLAFKGNVWATERYLCFYVHGLKFSQSAKCVMIDVAHHLKCFHCLCSCEFAQSRCLSSRLVLTLLSKQVEAVLFIWLLNKDHELTVSIGKGLEHLPIPWLHHNAS